MTQYFQKLLMCFVLLMLWGSIGTGCSSCGGRKASGGENTTELSSLAAKTPQQEQQMKEMEPMKNIFKAQVAGQFYSGNPAELKREITDYLATAKAAGAGSTLAERDLVGVLSPHAGYVYSGPVAAYSFSAAAAHASQYSTVVVMALSHRRASRSISILDMDGYETPLGTLAIDRDIIQKMLKDKPELFAPDVAMFENEHSLEVQLPFIQVAVPNVKIVPIVVATYDEALLQKAGAYLFDALGAFSDVLFVISSDLSHFFPYDEAKEYDNASLSLLEKWDIPAWVAHASQTRKGMCGVKPMFTFSQMFEQFDSDVRQVTLLKYMNSGDTAGDKRQVVGYGALAFSIPKGLRSDRLPQKDFGPYTPALRKELMAMAKAAVRAAAKGDIAPLPEPQSEVLKQSGAAFVTLKKNGQLRGCIGHVIARLPLYRCIEDVARAAAVRDTRFTPVTVSELDDLSYEISILTKPEPITPEDVVVGRDGLIISRGMYSGLLLPQVPIEWNWDRDEFLAHTCRKAGLPMDCWKDDATRIEAFRAIVFGEADLD
ncbi:MAG: AmmeMemoRadiSam system protein B [Deltaproteobacteria bacterium]|nr:AmmeMemoRadiSam system protein B [Deltaproteobacteria bacterium]